MTQAKNNIVPSSHVAVASNFFPYKCNSQDIQREHYILNTLKQNNPSISCLILILNNVFRVIRSFKVQTKSQVSDHIRDTYST